MGRNQLVRAAALMIAASLFVGCNKEETKTTTKSNADGTKSTTSTETSVSTPTADKAMDAAKNLKASTEGKLADAKDATKGAMADAKDAAKNAGADAKAAVAGAMDGKTAVATIAPAKGAATQPANQAVMGTVTFTSAGDAGVKVVADLSGLSPGKHGIHIHEKADLSAPDLSSAGGHWDPDAHKQHGGPTSEAAMRHAGDLGNIEAGADGKAHLDVTVPGLTVGGGGKNDVVGHSVVIHAGEDDLKTAPAGNSGGRVAAGAIVAK